jgi:carboxyl-terminal processing protease
VIRLKRALRLLPLAALALPAALLLGGAKSPKLAAIEGPADETVREVIKSLEASSVERVPLERYTLFALDALAGFDRCLGRKSEGTALVLTCGSSSLTAPWPPRSSDEVAVLLSNAMRLLDPERVVRGDRTKVVARALARAVDDPFTAYLPPELVAAVTSSNTAMFAATAGVEVWPRDPSKVREVRRGSDAASAGIEPGDRILAIDDVPTAGLTLPEIGAKLQGANDSVVKLTMKTRDGDRVFRVARTMLPENEIITRQLERRVLYVMLPAFKQGSAQRIAQVLWDTRPAGVILDLRHNGGGYVPEGIALADLFLRDGTIAGVRSGPGRPTEDFQAKRDPNDVTEPLVILVDGGSASASELLAMVLKERKRAVVLGSQTAGKGSVQRQIHMPDGGILKVTAGYYVGPTGRRLDENGVTPDRFLAPAQTKTVLEGGDPRKDSWVLSALDALQGARAPIQTSAGIGPSP